jgi:hypothetical protein
MTSVYDYYGLDDENSRTYYFYGSEDSTYQFNDDPVVMSNEYGGAWFGGAMFKPDGTEIEDDRMYANDPTFDWSTVIYLYFNGGMEPRSGNYLPISDLTGAAVTPPTPALTAKPTASTVLINGENKSFDAYNIADNNYFKLRDLAFVLNGTEKQFSVGYDEATKAITLTSGQAYTPVGGELTGKGDGVKTPKPTASKITLDGKEVILTVYIIEDNNYFKLRDVGEAFDFGVDWDGVNSTIVIDTGKGYTPE